MVAGVLSFNGPNAIVTNADWVYSLIWTDADNNPIDLTGCSVEMSIGNEIPPTETYITLTSIGDDPTIILDAVNGIIKLSLPESITTTLPIVINGVYDLLIFFPDGEIFRLLQGPIQILDGVTIG